MNLNNLYDIAEKENIKIYNHYIENTNGAFINVKDINAIVMNYKEIETSAKEKCVLSEELGHYYTDATYSPYCVDTTYISKQEYKAKKWSYNTLIPYEKLLYAISNGYRDYYSLAEYFDVTVDYIIDTIDFYAEKYEYKTNDKVVKSST